MPFNMRKTGIYWVLPLLMAIILALSACTSDANSPVAQATDQGLESQAWMNIDMSWVPGQNYDGISIMEIRRQDTSRLEISHVPVTGQDPLDQTLADIARARMNQFEADADQTKQPKRFMLECAVTQDGGNLISVVFAQQDSLPKAEHPLPLVSQYTYDKSTGQVADPLAVQNIDSALQDTLASLLRQQLAASGAVSGDEDWLVDALKAGGSAWKNTIIQKEGTALLITAPSGQLAVALADGQTLARAKDILNPPETPSIHGPDGTKPTGKKLVALTFDDGPVKSTTPGLLDILKRYHVKATFFVQGKNAEINPDIITRIHQEGHEIGNHTYSHKDLTKISIDKVNEELDKTANIVEAASGVKPALMRPPYGSTTYKLRDQLKLPVVKWSVEPRDSYDENTDNIVNTVLHDTNDGDIILLHDTHQYSIDAVPRIIEELEKKGFTFVTVTELLTRNGGTLKAGESYRYCRPAKND